MIKIVVGLQSGDEGKAKIVDYLMQKADACVRFSGGPNAGHTVVIRNDKFKLHLIPAGILSNKKSYLASSVLISAESLAKEIEEIKSCGYDVSNNLKISPDCHVITNNHVERDCVAENTENGVGSTKRGMSPCSSDKYGRKGIRIESLKDFESYYCDVPYEINKLNDEGKTIIFEGAQGTLLDIDHGTTYPNISTTTNVAGAACSSAGIGPTKVREVVGVFKPYLTKVGVGPFPTLIEDEKYDDHIVRIGDEFGATTGRRRKVGWLDLPALNYAIRINGCTSLALTKFDVIQDLDSIKVCTFYKLNDKFLNTIPYMKYQYDRCVPQYVTIKPDIDFLLQMVQDYVNVKVKYVSTGADRKLMKEI